MLLETFKCLRSDAIVVILELWVSQSGSGGKSAEVGSLALMGMFANALTGFEAIFGKSFE